MISGVSKKRFQHFVAKKDEIFLPIDIIK